MDDGSSGSGRDVVIVCFDFGLLLLPLAAAVALLAVVMRFMFQVPVESQGSFPSGYKQCVTRSIKYDLPVALSVY